MISSVSDHISALESAGLGMKEYPTMKNLRETKEQEKTRKGNRRRKQYIRNRSVFFCVGFAKFWKDPIHRVLTDLCKKFGLSWLRISMSYHRFPNLREIFSSLP